MTVPKTNRLVIVSVLALVLGCRAGNGSGAADAGSGPDGGAGTPDTTDADASAEAPTRLEPPIVRPAADVVVETIAGSSTKGSADGVGAAAQFDNPVGVLLDPSGGLFITEYDGGRLRKLDGAGASSTVATGLVEAFGMLLTGDAIYVQTDSDRNGQKGPDTGTIRKLPLGGGPPEVVIESLGRPRGLARLLDGRIVVADRESEHDSRSLDPTDRSLTLLADLRGGLRGRTRRRCSVQQAVRARRPPRRQPPRHGLVQPRHPKGDARGRRERVRRGREPRDEG